jgi:hypothetical protein
LSLSTLCGLIGGVLGAFWTGISFKGTSISELPTTIGFLVIVVASAITISLFFKRLDSDGYFERMGQVAQRPLLMTDQEETMTNYKD